MVATVRKLLSFEEFLAQDLAKDWPSESGADFELREGVPVPISEPNARHEDVVDGLCRVLADLCKELGLPYVVRQGKQVRLGPNAEGVESSRKADVVVFDREEWPRMRQLSASAAAYVAPPLVIEVVSTNWRDDYRIKLNEYEALGIPEYWIVDYAGLGGVQYIGLPKQPTVTVNRLIDGEYLAFRHQGDEAVASPLFPQLALTTAQVVAMTES